MTTMQLVTTESNLLDRSDDALEAWFSEAGLTVTVVAHCDDVACPVCFGALPARAA